MVLMISNVFINKTIYLLLFFKRYRIYIVRCLL